MTMQSLTSSVIGRRVGMIVAAAVLLAGGASLFAGDRAAAQQTGKPQVIIPAAETRIFNGKDLSGWYTFFPSQGVNKDPENIITVQKDGVIKVTGKEFGYFATVNDYAYYHLTFDVRWGDKKYPPREKAVRDSGVLVHMIGPDKVWPQSFECQVQENDFGDIFHIGGISSMVNSKRQNGRVVRSQSFEKPHGEWNTVECIVNGDAVTNIVNGQVVNVATGITRAKNGEGGRLNYGKIAFQSEGAEVYYRNIVIRPLSP
ncbi:MAG: DUF1080 domain-containing protein [Armatimonadaceae bacterium]